MIIPDGHNKDHTVIHGFSHLFKTTLNLEIVWISHLTFLGVAHIISDRIVWGNIWNLRIWSFEDLAVLNENSSDFFQVSSVGTIGSNELSNNLDWLGSINSFSWTIEIVVTGSIWVEITSIFIADTLVSFISLTALKSLTFLWSSHGTWMSSESLRDRVGLPDIHLSAASSEFSGTGIWVSWGWRPSN